MEKVRGLQNLAYQLGLEEGKFECYLLKGSIPRYIYLSRIKLLGCCCLLHLDSLTYSLHVM